MTVTITENKEKVERLKAIKAQIEELSKEKKEIEDRLSGLEIYQNDDGTWTRFSKVDNMKELEKTGQIYRAAPINRYSTKLETLKNKPKELKD